MSYIIVEIFSFDGQTSNLSSVEDLILGPTIHSYRHHWACFSFKRQKHSSRLIKTKLLTIKTNVLKHQVLITDNHPLYFGHWFAFSYFIVNTEVSECWRHCDGINSFLQRVIHILINASKKESYFLSRHDQPESAAWTMMKGRKRLQKGSMQFTLHRSTQWLLRLPEKKTRNTIFRAFHTLFPIVTIRDFPLRVQCAKCWICKCPLFKAAPKCPKCT